MPFNRPPRILPTLSKESVEIPSPPQLPQEPGAFSWLGILLPVGGMLLMSTLIGLPFAFTAKHERVNKIVRISAGVVSLCFGAFLAWQIGFVEGLFFG